MPNGTRQIRLTFPETRESVVAELLDHEAPRVCEEVWNMLPIEKKLIHGMYSGPEIFLLLDHPQALPLENQVQLPLPGEILFFHDEGTSAAGGNTAVSEICIVYGRGVSLKQHEAVPTFASLFACIHGDWKRDWPEFAEACCRVRTEGPCSLRIERA